MVNGTDENFIDIGATDYHFHCKFARNEGDSLIPWVEIRGQRSVTVDNTCEASV